MASKEVERYKKPKFKVETFALEFKPGIDPNRLNQLVDELEAEEYARKMGLQTTTK